MISLGSSNKNNGGGDKVNNFVVMAARRIRFPNSDIEAGMMLQLWNNFSGPFSILSWLDLSHNEWLVRINLPPQDGFKWLWDRKIRLNFLFLHGHREKKEDARKKEIMLISTLHRWWLSFSEHLFSVCLLSVCLYGYLYESSYMYKIEFWNYIMSVVNCYLFVFQIDCNTMYSAYILILFFFQIKEILIVKKMKLLHCNQGIMLGPRGVIVYCRISYLNRWIFF